MTDQPVRIESGMKSMGRVMRALGKAFTCEGCGKLRSVMNVKPYQDGFTPQAVRISTHCSCPDSPFEELRPKVPA